LATFAAHRRRIREDILEAKDQHFRSSRRVTTARRRAREKKFRPV